MTAMSTVAPQSPCVNVCTLDAHGLCVGCYRTIHEIAEWASMTDAERAAVLRSLGDRARTRARYSRN